MAIFIDFTSILRANVQNSDVPVACRCDRPMLQQIATPCHRVEGEIPMGVERSAMRKVYWRLLPLTILVYFLCYLDRINVGFAALTMNKDLGLDAATYGMAAGAFFWAISCLRSRATSS